MQTASGAAVSAAAAALAALPEAMQRLASFVPRRGGPGASLRGGRRPSSGKHTADFRPAASRKGASSAPKRQPFTSDKPPGSGRGGSGRAGRSRSGGDRTWAEKAGVAAAILPLRLGALQLLAALAAPSLLALVRPHSQSSLSSDKSARTTANLLQPAPATGRVAAAGIAGGAAAAGACSPSRFLMKRDRLCSEAPPARSSTCAPSARAAGFII